MSKVNSAIIVASLAIHMIISYVFSSSCYVNTGFSFGLINNIELYQAVLLNLVPLMFIAIVLVKINRENRLYKIRSLLIALLIAGLLNLIDRLIHGGVCDYIVLHESLPVFNINDVVVLWVISKMFLVSSNGKY